MFESLTDDQRAQLLGALNDLLKSKKGQSIIESQIQELTDSAVSVELSFRTVGQNFLQAERDASPYQKHISPLRMDWDAYHKEYLRLLWLSRDVAGKARVTLNDFTNEFLEFIADPTQDINEKKEEIATLKSKLVDGEKTAVSLKDGFQKLKDNIDAMQHRVGSLIKQYKNAIPGLESRTRDLQKEIADAQAGIGRMHKQMVGSTTTTFTIATGFGAVAVIGCFCPLIWITALVGIGAVMVGGCLVLSRQTIMTLGLNDKEKKAFEELKKTTDAKNDMLRISQILSPLPLEMENISARLMAFESVWQPIQADLVEIEGKLEKVEEATAKQLFKSRLRTANTSGVALSRALYLYQTTLDTRGIPRVRH